MPAPELTHRHQLAVLWEASGFDDEGNPKRVLASEEIHVRLEETIGQAIGPTGRPITYDAMMHVDREIEVGSVIYLGSLDELAAVDPTTGTGTDLAPADDVATYYEVIGSDNTPDVRGRVSNRWVYLRRKSDALPDVES